MVISEQLSKEVVGSALAFGSRRAHDDHPINELVDEVLVPVLDGIELFGGHSQ
jgi:hypothetical protein